MTNTPQSSYFLSFEAAANTLYYAGKVMLSLMFHTLNRAKVDRYTHEWSALLLKKAEIQLTIQGQEHIAPNETFIVMSNHQSHYDIPVLYQSFPLSLRMVAKTELFKIPIFGQALQASECVEIDRKNSVQSRQSMNQAAALIQSGINIWIAPEGTRSTTGQLGPFKKGGFILALNTHTRILPVTINGTHHILPSRQLKAHRQKNVDVIFHAPVHPDRYGYEKRNELIADVRHLIEHKLVL